MDGEIGRFKFSTFDVISSAGKAEYEVGRELYPGRKGEEWYQTIGFKEIAIYGGVVQRSYRQTVEGINRTRHQEEGGTVLKTLRDSTEASGREVIDFQEKKSAKIFTENGFSSDGRVTDERMVVKQIEENSCEEIESREVSLAMESVRKEMLISGMKDELIVEMKRVASVSKYWKPEEVVNVHIDDVGVKKQKEHRSKSVEASETGTGKKENTGQKKRPTVYNTVAHLQHGGKSYTLTGARVIQVLLLLLACLLENHLAYLILFCYTDGARSLQGGILSFFSWHSSLILILDWFHLVKKVKETLSLACKGLGIRNRHSRALIRLLWYGLVDQAIEYTQKIPASDLKKAQTIDQLIGYFERNRTNIPCYAVRKKLGLLNSSNPVERSNNLVTSRRQKHNGMSWSKRGSHALTALTAVVGNRTVEQWTTEKKISFRLVSQAA